MLPFLFDLFHIFPFLETFTESETTASNSECSWWCGGGLCGVWHGCLVARGKGHSFHFIRNGTE